MFTRPRRGKLLAGVCAGLARQIGMPTWLMRLFWLISAAIIPGVSIFMVLALYVVLALVTPWDNPIVR